jgi:hypothetical protein
MNIPNTMTHCVWKNVVCEPHEPCEPFFDMSCKTASRIGVIPEIRSHPSQGSQNEGLGLSPPVVNGFRLD